MSADRNSNNPRKDPAEGPVSNTEIDEFFQRLPANFRWPKPNAEAVAAAVEAIQRMPGSAAAAQELAAAGDESPEAHSCSACGGSLPAGARFCVWCGVPNSSGCPRGTCSIEERRTTSFPPSLSPSGPQPRRYSGAPAAETESTAPRGRAPGSPGPAPGGRAEASARQVVQDWAQACNTRHIDDLIELYAPDATLIRSSVPPVRSLPAIREFLVSLLEAGLGDVEMESLRVEVMGDIALDIGRCKMLVPVAMGKRREERGKYLIVLARQAAGTWKILADSWSSDLAVGASAPDAARKGK